MALIPNSTAGAEEGRLLVRYLLEDLSEVERDRVERRYFGDEDFYTKLLVTEEELIDSYVQDDMPREDRERFERVYLTDPRMHGKVEANRELLELVGRQSSPFAVLRRRILRPVKRALTPRRSNGFAYVLAGALLVAALCGLSGWLLFESARVRRESERSRAQWQEKEVEYQRRLAEAQSQPSPTQDVTPTQTPAPGPREDRLPDLEGVRRPGAQQRTERAAAADERQRPASAVIAFALPRPGVRAPRPDGGAPRTLVIPRGAVLVRLTLDIVPNEYPDYVVSLQKVGGRRALWSQTVTRNAPPSAADRLTIDLPAALFQSQDYLLQVTSHDPAGEEEILSRHQITADVRR